MTQPVDIDLNLGGDYADGVQQATSATEGLATALSAIQAPARGVQQALDHATPSKAHLAAWGGFTAAAAYFQDQTSGIRATASAAGQSMRVLDGDVRRLASSFPIGTAGAVAMVQAVQGLGAQQGRILPLAQTFERLSAATNSFGPEIAQGFGQLNRAMASLDPERVARFGDVLTTVSAKSGASAMGIINFAHAIAPVAQQAGIGESAVLGISSAFVKLGDDGGAAATAVNKILSDLNRSVREGSNDMAAYAQVTGTTVSQFKALYEANPAQALTAVTTAIGRAPAGQGQMMLESLGLEGPRTQRALLQLSQSGGLSGAINQAVGAYGNGSTQQAAAAALGGLNDSLTELRSTAGQTADALGGPFLHILTRITNLAKIGLGPVNAVLGSGPGQNAILTAGALAATGMVARRVLRPLGTTAIAAQMATSGPIRSLAGGYAIGRVGEEAALGGGTESLVAGRFGRQAIAMQMLGQGYGRGFMQPINAGFMRGGAVLGQFRSDLAGENYGVPGGQIGPAIGGPGFLGTVRRGARLGIGASSMAYEGWMRAFADPFHQAVTPAGERQSLLSTSEGGLFQRANTVRQQAGIRAAMGMLEQEGGRTSAILARFGSATLGATKAIGTFSVRTLEAAAPMAAGVGRGALDLVGGPLGAATLAAGGVYEIYKHAQSQTNSLNSTMRNTDINQVENSWLDSVGAASKGAVTMADAMAAATNTINASVTNFPTASTVSNRDVVAAGRFDAGKQRATAPLNYALGDVSSVQALAQANSLGGMTPQGMQGLKISMLRQGVPEDRINAVLGGLNTGGTGGRITGRTATGLARAYSSAVASYDKQGHGTFDTDAYAGRDATKVAQTIASSLATQQQMLTEKFGTRYATQQTVRALGQIMGATPANRRYTLSHALGASLGYTGSGGGFNTQDTLNLPGVSIGGMSGKQLTDLLRGPSVQARLQPSILEQPLRSVGANALLPFFTAATAPAPFRRGQNATTFLGSGHEEDVSAQTQAVMAIVDAAHGAGSSLRELAVEATKATSVTASWQQALQQGIAAEAQFRQQVALQGAGRAEQLTSSVRTDLGYIAAGPGTDPNGFQAQQYSQARQDLASQRQSVIEYYQQRVMAQYQFQIQSERAQEDYQRQVGRSEQDFFISRQRAYQDFSISMKRQRQDAAQSLYNPYQRIEVQPVWDAVNLTGNRGEQIHAMRQQIRDIHKLRELGLSDDSINQLKLYDPANYMQVEQLLSDLQADHGMVNTLNRQSATMLNLSGQLVSQSPEYRRQREDFKRSMGRQQDDFNRQQSRAQQDYKTSMTRMAQDLQMQDLQITNNMTKLTHDMNKILHGQAIDLKNQVESTLATMLNAVDKQGPKINSGLRGVVGGVVPGQGYGGPGGGRTITGTPMGPPGGAGPSNMHRVSAPGVNQGFLVSSDSRPGTDTNRYGNPDLHWGKNIAVAPDRNRLSTNARIAHDMAEGYGWKGRPEWDALFQIWQQESGFSTTAGAASRGRAYGIPQAMWSTKASNNPMSAYGADWRTNPHTQIAWGLNYIASRYGDPLGAWAHKSRTGWYGAGGVFSGPTIAGVGEKGPEAVIPLNGHGLEFMVSALHRYVGTSEAKMIGSGGLASATHITFSNDTYHIDQGQHLHGPVTVKANTPSEFANQAFAAKRAQNAASARGVAWSRS